MDIHTEFPDFDNFPAFDSAAAVLADVGFTDSSYRNDVCPSLEIEFADESRLVLWIEYANRALRESPDSCNYFLAVYDESGDCTELGGFDEWADAIHEARKFAKEIGDR